MYYKRGITRNLDRVSARSHHDPSFDKTHPADRDLVARMRRLAHLRQKLVAKRAAVLDKARDTETLIADIQEFEARVWTQIGMIYLPCEAARVELALATLTSGEDQPRSDKKASRASAALVAAKRDMVAADVVFKAARQRLIDVINQN